MRPNPLSRGRHDALIREMYAEDPSVQRIMDATGATRGQVCYRLAHLEIAYPYLLGRARKPGKAPEKIRRKCLKCRGPFQAEKGIFLCDPCKSTKNWHAGIAI